MKNSKEALEGAYNNALDLILNKKLKEGEKLLEKFMALKYKYRYFKSFRDNKIYVLRFLWS